MSSISLWIQRTCSSFFSTPLYQNHIIRSAFTFLGGALIATKLLSSLRVLLQPLFLFEKDHAARYGKGSWVLITGASHSIGKSFCFQFAKRGFNVVLIDIDQASGEAVAQEIKNMYPGVQTRFIAADFAKADEEGFVEKIEEQTRDLDISVLVNNVGLLLFNQYTDITIKQIKDITIVNCLTQALLTRVFLPRLLKRSQKSAIINISSHASCFPRQHVQVYAASKVFVDYLSRGLNHEYPNLDILSMKPSFVSTRMASYKPIDFETITADDFTSITLKNLGNTVTTYGAWKHRLQFLRFYIMPEFIRNKYSNYRWNRYRKLMAPK